jgi:hypothetical protein
MAEGRSRSGDRAVGSLRPGRGRRVVTTRRSSRDSSCPRTSPAARPRCTGRCRPITGASAAPSQRANRHRLRHGLRRRRQGWPRRCSQRPVRRVEHQAQGRPAGDLKVLTLRHRRVAVPAILRLRQLQGARLRAHPAGLRELGPHDLRGPDQGRPQRGRSLHPLNHAARG